MPEAEDTCHLLILLFYVHYSPNSPSYIVGFLTQLHFVQKPSYVELVVHLKN